MSEILADGIRATRKRLEAVRGAAGDLDRRIADLERRESEAAPAAKLALARELRALRDQRAVAGELLSEAEVQHARERSARDEAVQRATRDLSRIGKGCSDAAGRFDRALSDAMRALDDLEREAEPLIGTLIGELREYLHPRHINAAIAFAFERRLGRSIGHSPKASLSSCIAVMVSDAREAAAQLKKEAA